MANKNPTEISLMKGLSVKLDNDVLFTFGYFVHTEDHARDKSEYIYAGRIDKTSDLLAEADNLAIDANRVLKWKWKGLQKYDAVVYDKDDTNARGARWLKLKAKKAVDWDTFCKIVDGWQEAKKAYNDNAKYVCEDFTASDGTRIANLKANKEDLLKLVGQTVYHKCQLKSQL